MFAHYNNKKCLFHYNLVYMCVHVYVFVCMWKEGSQSKFICTILVSYAWEDFKYVFIESLQYNFVFLVLKKMAYIGNELGTKVGHG